MLRKPAAEPGRGLVLLRWTALVAALTGLVGVLIGRRLFFGNDDLLEFAAARDHGLSWTTLSLNVWEHFAPYNRFLHYLVFRSSLSTGVALALVLANVAAMLAAALWLMAELGVTPGRRVVALVWIALLVATTETALWLDSAFHVLPAIAMTLLFCAASIRAVRTGSRRWWAGAVALFLLGQLTQERPLFGLPLLVLILLLVLWRDLSWRVRWRRLWQQRAPLAVLVLLALGITAALRAFVVIDQFGQPGWATTARALLSSFSNYALPSMVNLPLAAPAATVVQLLVAAGALAAGLALARAGRGNGGLLGFTAAAFLLYYGFLKFSPLLNAGTVQANAERLNYAIYVAVPAIIAVVQLRLPLARRPLRDRDRPARPAPRRAALAGGAVLLTAFLGVTNEGYLDRVWPQAAGAHDWVEQVRAGAADWGAPGTSLVPLHAPKTMTTSWAWPYGREDWLLSLIRPGFQQEPLGGRLIMLDGSGRVRPAALQPVAPLRIVDGGCAGASDPTHRRADFQATGAWAEPMFLLVDYRATAPAAVQLATQRGTSWTTDPLPTRLPAGRHTMLLPVDFTGLDWAAVLSRTPGARLCVEHARVVRPLLQDGPATCRPVDRYGRPGEAVRCPAPPVR